ncbi:hypothetical protein HT031_003038 [Scenedesmus sp. PABB004]|nr:hypothetical protein HT031_003038 [Scenedesmus sp. PABB004]
MAAVAPADAGPGAVVVPAPVEEPAVDRAKHPSGIVPQLQNVVATVDLGCKLELKDIALHARNAEYNPKRFAAVIMRIREPKTTALIFASGKMVCTGAKSEAESRLAAKKYCRIVQRTGFEEVKMKDFKIQNMVGSCDVKFPIRLEGLAYSHGYFATYEPELFPGLIYRMKDPKIVLLIFVSGKVVLTGAKQREQIYAAFENIYPTLQEFRKRDAADAAGLAALAAAPAGADAARAPGAPGSSAAAAAAGGLGGGMMPPPARRQGGPMQPPPATPGPEHGAPAATPAHHDSRPPPTPQHAPPATPAYVPPATPAWQIPATPGFASMPSLPAYRAPAAPMAPPLPRAPGAPPPKQSIQRSRAAMQSLQARSARCGVAQRGSSRLQVVARAEAIAVPAGKKVEPKGDRVLVKVAKQEEKTRGGILLPVSAQKRPTSGDVVSLGDGRVGDGSVRPFTLKPGQTVLYSKFGFMYTELKAGEDELILIREDDVIGVLPRSDAVADDIPELVPLGDRVLIRVEETADVTIGGVVLPDSAKERPLSGTVVRAGPGKYDADAEGGRKAMIVKPGDKVLYFKYAGDNMETPDGAKFIRASLFDRGTIAELRDIGERRHGGSAAPTAAAPAATAAAPRAQLRARVSALRFPGSAKMAPVLLDEVDARSYGGGLWVRNEFLIDFAPGTPPDERARIERLIASEGGAVIYRGGVAFEGLVFRGPESLAGKVHVLNCLVDSHAVQRAAPNMVSSVDAVQRDPGWGLDRIDARKLPLNKRYAYNSTGAGVTVYVVDSGVATAHADFGGRAAFGADLINDGSLQGDCHGHGTHVAGVVAGTRFGAAKRASVVSVRILDCTGAGDSSAFFAALDWITADATGGARRKRCVVNLSISFGGAVPMIDDAIRNAQNASGCAFVVAAGNSNKNACTYSPGSTAEAITVGATDAGDARSSFSNFGRCLDLFAPGSVIPSASNTDPTGTVLYSGTSQAAPHVAGAARGAQRGAQRGAARLPQSRSRPAPPAVRRRPPTPPAARRPPPARAGVAALFLSRNPTASPQQVRDALVAGAARGVLTGIGTGSPNRLLWNHW